MPILKVKSETLNFRRSPETLENNIIGSLHLAQPVTGISGGGKLLSSLLPILHGFHNLVFFSCALSFIVCFSCQLPIKNGARSGIAHGVFNSATKEAVIKFQRKIQQSDPSFEVDGVVGSMIYAQLA